MSIAIDLTQALRRALRAQNITYRDLGQRLDLSEAAVKRMFSLKAMSLQRLEEICDVLGLGLAELLADAGRGQVLSELSHAQEEALVKDPRLLMGLFLVLNRWRYTDVAAHNNITEVEWTRILAALDRLGIIELQPGNHARLRTSRNFRWRRNGPMEQFFRKQLLGDYFSTPFEGEQDALYLLTGALSTEGSQQLRERMGELAREFDALLARDATLSVEQRQGVVLVLAQKPWTLQTFSQYRRTDAPKNADA